VTVTAEAPSRRRFFRLLLSSANDPRVLVIAWLNLIANVVIIATGGTVRLTGSGLGCDQWPGCTTTSFLPGIDDGIHGFIEFGNRTLSGLLAILAILAVLSVWRLRRERRDLWVHAWIILGGVLVQALIGMIVVFSGLAMSTVGIHYFLSAALVGVATSFVIRVRRSPGLRGRAVPLWMFVVTHVTTLLMAGVVILGIFTTGSGPHSGDEDVIRDSSDWEQLAHTHAWLGYMLAAALVVLLIGAMTMRQTRYLGAVIAVVIVVAVQITVGIVQARLGLPPLLVGVHMVLAAVSVAVTVVLLDSLKTMVPAAGTENPANA
jgi:cytochrome c oxidase assembly protein subunit 15